MINMDTMKITATKVKITGRNKDDLPGYKNDHKYYKKSDGGFNQKKMDQEDLKNLRSNVLEQRVETIQLELDAAISAASHARTERQQPEVGKKAVELRVEEMIKELKNTTSMHTT
nr:hypothetical protein [Tanacetum cinerariifolium]